MRTKVLHLVSFPDHVGWRLRSDLTSAIPVWRAGCNEYALELKVWRMANLHDSRVSILARCLSCLSSRRFGAVCLWIRPRFGVRTPNPDEVVSWVPPVQNPSIQDLVLHWKPIDDVLSQSTYNHCTKLYINSTLPLDVLPRSYHCMNDLFRVLLPRVAGRTCDGDCVYHQ